MRLHVLTGLILLQGRAAAEMETHIILLCFLVAVFLAFPHKAESVEYLQDANCQRLCEKRYRKCMIRCQAGSLTWDMISREKRCRRFYFLCLFPCAVPRLAKKS
ncbi:hypothetical protein NP493_566g02003 [Ridgeia piscesae]|uniref:Uncharacterized protein n=1 Tax=Ridgeia piscesae TaxID=27915 RepID=A0AAD9NRG2_RIDPI|nr:hypothetical protein NP493_566g02003 [Ridgeia piscesae]